MQRIIVDLPEPDGPQTTMRSPRMTLRLMFLSTWKSPYHLFTSTISIAASVRRHLGADASRPRCRRLVIGLVLPSSPCPSFSAGGRCAAGAPCRSSSATCRSRTPRRPARQRHSRSPALFGAAQFGVGEAELDDAEQVEDADDQHQARVLEQADEAVDDARDDDAERLRQDDEPHHLPIAEADRLRRLVLAARDRLQAAADDLRHVGGGEERDADQRPEQLVEGHARRQEDRQHHARHEQDRDQRHAADEFDEA